MSVIKVNVNVVKKKEIQSPRNNFSLLRRKQRSLWLNEEIQY
jgi:hypothetical protein